MRKVLVSLMVLSFLPGLATAVVTNPEGFEGYALTDDWQPTLAGEGWYMERTEENGAQVMSIVSDGAGGQVLDIYGANQYGFEGFPMWDADGPADADFAVTRSGFDIKPIDDAMGSEFVAKFARYSDADSSNYAEYPAQDFHSTWEVGIRVGRWTGFGPPYGPVEPPPSWFSLGTLVYLRTWVGPDETYTETEIPGYGEGVWIVPSVTGTPPEVTSEWWRMEIEEDNVTQQTRARMYLRGGTPSAGRIGKITTPG
ncbi:hypothetical protein LCGC14_3037040 [marine sediment metagenome]|uniref:Uncharacterized protein n=1 Tax=marine sediment metagenome TaxID=412755 RepID=A0A0F8YYP6_9ZZZZ